MWYGNSTYQGKAKYQETKQKIHKYTIKKSGATYTKISKGDAEGLFHVSAWRLDKNRLVTAQCFPHRSKKTGVYTFISDKNKKEYCHYIIELKGDSFISVVPGLMSKETKKLYIPKLNLVISKNGKGITGNGKPVSGYFGKIPRK